MINKDNLLIKIKNSVESVLPKDIELVNLEVKNAGRKILVKILVDKNTGGITLDECADLNHKIGKVLDSQDFLLRSYFLDVSSPGVSYPLKTKKDFSRNIGKKIRIFLNYNDNVKEIEGYLKEIEKDFLFLELSTGEQLKIKLKDIDKAKQII